MDHSTPEHFKGKSVAEHLKEARTKGVQASREVHGVEMPGHMAAFADAAKETAILFLIFWVLNLYFSFPLSLIFQLGILITISWAIWKTGRSALIGWARLNRLHRLIEEERWEITHHRQQEKDELKEMYRAKGLTGQLLDEVIDVLMADDNRLLRIMLEEELGLTLEAYEHPLKQAIGACLGVLVSGTILIFANYLNLIWATPIAAAVILWLCTHLSAKVEGNPGLPASIWTLSLAFLTTVSLYFLFKLMMT